MRACVIFNPTARGEKANRFRRQLDGIATEAKLRLTAEVGEARRLAAEAVDEGFEVIVAAGGDGTLNEVLNGIADAPEGLERACLGVLPLGTVNVFAREVAIPAKFDQAWAVIRRGRTLRIDLPSVEYSASPPFPLSIPWRGGQGERRVQRRCFAQLAGAGLDARAIELVKWQVKKTVGPMAYVLAGLHAVLGVPSKITAAGAGHSTTGELAMIGNGRFYGGQFTLFPQADLRDGLLEVCVLPRANWLTLVRCTPALLLCRTLPASVTKIFQAPSLTLTSPTPAPLQIDGELIGQVPAAFSIQRSRLRVIVP